MEEDGSVATTTCVMAATRFLGSHGVESYHDPLFSSSSSPAAALINHDSTAASSSEVALMGNLLTDMLSSDFPYNTSRYSSVLAPDILQFSRGATDQQQLTLLHQMLEESAATHHQHHHDNNTTTGSASSSPFLKLPVLEEPSDTNQPKFICSSSSADHDASCPTPKSLLKACKVEPTDSSLLQLHRLVSPAGGFNSTAAASENTSSGEENVCKAVAAATISGGAASQSSSGTEVTVTPQQQGRPKRKRIKSCKNSEEVESQRQTHIAVERNRRKQMNEHLNVLRSLMPGSYVQRGDQASIIGGAIEFVKELEQLLQCLQAQKRRRMYSEAFSPKPSPTVTSMLQQQQQQQQSCSFNPPPPSLSLPPPPPPYSPHQGDSKFVNDNFYEPMKEIVAEAKSEVADIEVKMVGSGDAVVKILSQRRPGQLLKTISALENMCMTIVHTNITTIEQTVLYSFTVKIGMESRLAVEEIAEAIQRAFSLIHSSASSSSGAA